MEFNRIEMQGKTGKILWIPTIFGIFFFLQAFQGAAPAQEKYPTKPINFIIGYPAGGTTDVCARPLVMAASKILGQPIVVLNKPGGGSAVAIASLKIEKPDGYTIGVLPSGAVLSQHMRKVPYDSAKDFTPIMQYASIPLRAGGAIGFSLEDLQRIYRLRQGEPR